MRISFTIAVIACTLACGAEVQAGESASPEEVIAKVKEAVALLSSEGDAALSEIGDPTSRFRWKDTYVFVVDCEADTVLANAAFPERVGGDILEHSDYAGFRYGTALCETAQQPGGGWIEYTWLRPGRAWPERKTSFVMSTLDGSYQVGAGIYGSKLRLDALHELSGGVLAVPSERRRGE